MSFSKPTGNEYVLLFTMHIIKNQNLYGQTPYSLLVADSAAATLLSAAAGLLCWLSVAAGLLCWLSAAAAANSLLGPERRMCDASVDELDRGPGSIEEGTLGAELAALACAHNLLHV